MVLKTFWASLELPLLVLHIHRSQADPLVERVRDVCDFEKDPLDCWKLILIDMIHWLIITILDCGTQVRTDPVGLIMVKIAGVPRLQFLSKGQNIHLLASRRKLLSGLWGPPTSMTLK